MDVHLTRQLELARIEARRRHHDAVEPEHLLAIALAQPNIDAELRQTGIDPVELRDKVDVRLDARPMVGGYRDSSDVPISPALARVVERLDVRGWRRLIRRTTVIDALTLEPIIASMVFELRRGNDHRHILHRARALAVLSEHFSVDLVHVFRAFLDLRSFVDAVERADGDIAGLRTCIETVLAANPRAHEPKVEPPLESNVRDVISAAEHVARSGGAASATIRQLCLELARHEDAARFWTAAGIGVAAFVRAVHLPEQTFQRARSLLR